MNIANVTNAKAFLARHFARVDDKAASAQLCVKLVKVEIVRGILERRDDGRLELWRDEGAKSEAAQTLGNYGLARTS